MMRFDPERDPCIDAEKWKPNASLVGLALRRCSWVNCDAINEITDADEWLRAVIVGAYFQGVADIVRHNSRKLREAKEASNGPDPA